MSIAITKSLPKNTGTVIVKHANPCGVSINKDKIKSFKQALNCDPISAFGGIVCCNFKINKKIATELDKTFFEVIIGNKIDKEAIKILKKRKNLRIIDALKSNVKDTQSVISNFGNFLIQTNCGDLQEEEEKHYPLQ